MVKLLVSTGNEELDIKLQGGIPFPSLIIIEGGHGTSKTVLLQQFLYGALREGLRGLVLSTEMPSVDYIRKMKMLKMNVVDYVIRNKLDVFSVHSARMTWSEEKLRSVIERTKDFILSKGEGYDLIVIDSATFLLNFAPSTEIIDFFSKMKLLSLRGKNVLISIHPNVVEDDIATKLKAMCDGYIKLSIANIGGRTVKVMEIIKLRGAPSTFDSTISFDVDPAFGIKLIPIALARA